METILQEKQVKKFALENVFPKWQPDKITRNLEQQATRMKKLYLKTAL
jgi:hypothetical protein